MNYLELIPDIISRLRSHGAIAEADAVENAFRYSFPAGELLMATTHTLLAIIRNNNELHSLVGADTYKLQAYCTSVGLHVR